MEVDDHDDALKLARLHGRNSRQAARRTWVLRCPEVHPAGVHKVWEPGNGSQAHWRNWQAHYPKNKLVYASLKSIVKSDTGQLGVFPGIETFYAPLAT